MSAPPSVADESRSIGRREDRRGLSWRRVWPAALGVLVAAGTAYGLGDARDAAPVVVASGLVYLAAGATGRRAAAWIAFAVTFALIGLDKFAAVDALPWLFALAAVLLTFGLVTRRTRPWWAFPLQVAGMAAFGALAYVAVQLSPAVGGVLVGAALLGHAAWDLVHHRAHRVVDQRFAEFCAVLDVLVAVVVVVLALRS
ncbi:hypothetical protein JNB62_14625 [Microbacterium jejuense]|uniref:YhhN-like protein n=1 Tax=Microbacterium jejuense TaxID=1263637 RepID=A0ABS7HQD9_9MICO|nr:hypothetical protein [Microbacterium jejuense]MBW9094925.1 hypothetical protein [Microbacterium jejuense]